jgi:AcrR family transcriptional regulator
MARKRDETVKEKIIDEAIKLFLANGFVGSTVADLANTAGVAKGTVYWYFKSKNDILSGILERFESEFLDALIEKVNNYDGDFFHKFKLFYRFTTEFARDNRGLLLVYNTLLAEIVGGFSIEEQKMKAIQRRYNQFVEKLLDEGKREGVIGSGINSKIYSHIVTANFTGMLLQWYFNVDDLKDETEYARAFRDSIMKGLEIRTPVPLQKQARKGSNTGESWGRGSKKVWTGQKK